MKRKIILLGLVILGLSAGLAAAQSFCPLELPKAQPKTVDSLKAFKRMAVLHEGRIKPMDTYARSLLLRLSGRTSFDRRPAVEWLARLLFAPASTAQDKVFLINSPEIPMAIGLEPDPKRRYSFMELNAGFNKIMELAQVADQIDEKKRSIVEQEILRVYHNMVLYTQFSYVLSYAFPHPDFQIDDDSIITELDLPRDQQNQYSFLDIALRADALRKATGNMEMDAPQTWSEREKQLFRLLGSLYHSAQSMTDLPFHVVPSVDKDNEAWLGPWEAINMEFFDPNVQKEASLLRDMAVYYWNGEQLSFDLSARAFGVSVAKRVADHKRERKAIEKIPLELFYNKADFFIWAKLAYGLAFLLFLFFLYAPRPLWHKVAFALVVAGFIPHLTAIITRCMIMSRPPVSNLYETFIFVALVSVVLGLIIEAVNRQWVGLLVASVCGLVFLLISAKFSAEGDTMQMLVAVLDSNFWLGTHVISITIGYAGTCVAGLVGHLYIIQRCLRPKAKEMLDATYRNLIGTLAFGLTMTFFGTMLGGIWADQSWGRFWGWDPKENGALLIVIWCAILFHARIARMIGPLGMAVGAVLGIVVVMWAWFGVNLLSVGLHSYGFTSGVAGGLLIYVIAEILFLAVCGWVLRRQKP